MNPESVDVCRNCGSWLGCSYVTTEVPESFLKTGRVGVLFVVPDMCMATLPSNVQPPHTSHRSGVSRPVMAKGILVSVERLWQRWHVSSGEHRVYFITERSSGARIWAWRSWADQPVTAEPDVSGRFDQQAVGGDGGRESGFTENALCWMSD